MFRDSSSDQEDGFDDYGDDLVIRTIRTIDYASEDELHALERHIRQKTESLLVPNHKLDYLIAVCDEADDRDNAIMPAALSGIAGLYDDLSVDDKLLAASVVGLYANSDILFDQAVDVLEQNYACCISPREKILALTVLVNDDRIPQDDEDGRHFQRQTERFAQWQDAFVQIDDADKSQFALDVLGINRVCNGFKPALVKCVHDHLHHCPDPAERLRIILDCTAIKSDDARFTEYRADRVEPAYLPLVADCDWNEAFTKNTFALMQDEGYEDAFDAVEDMTCYRNFTGDVETALMTFNGIKNLLVAEDYRQSAQHDIAAADIADFNPRSASDLLHRPLRFLDWAADLNSLSGAGENDVTASDEERDDIADEEKQELHDGTVLNRFIKAYQLVKTKSAACRNKSVQNQIDLIAFKSRFLMQAHPDANVKMSDPVDPTQELPNETDYEDSRIHTRSAEILHHYIENEEALLYLNKTALERMRADDELSRTFVRQSNDLKNSPGDKATDAFDDYFASNVKSLVQENYLGDQGGIIIWYDAPSDKPKTYVADLIIDPALN